jgi:hypothetical protein
MVDVVKLIVKIALLLDDYLTSCNKQRTAEKVNKLDFGEKIGSGFSV